MNDSPVTQLLSQWRGGRDKAVEELMPLVYNELHAIARRAMQRQNAGHTLQPTAVVNEANLKLVGVDVDWSDRVHFFAVAARVMRNLLVDHAKAKHREKRGGSAKRIELDEEILGAAEPDIDVVELDQALRKLAELDERKSSIVELHYFGGMNYDETAEALSISPATVHRELRLAKAWLHREMSV